MLGQKLSLISIRHILKPVYDASRLPMASRVGLLVFHWCEQRNGDYETFRFKQYSLSLHLLNHMGLQSCIATLGASGWLLIFNQSAH
jgi:hypothetical protein